MTLDVVPFAEEHLDAAAALLATRHRRDRRRAPALPARYEAIEAARAEVQRLFAAKGAVGAFATRNGRPAGYLLGEPWEIAATNPFTVFVRPRSGAIPIAGHAVVPGMAREVYRALYAEVGGRWLEHGLDVHHAVVPAWDRPALGAFFALGFGHDNTLAARDTSPLAAPDPLAGEVRQALRHEGGILAEQALAILLDLTRTPACLPKPPESAGAALGQMIEGLLANADLAQWVAIRDGRAVAMQLFDRTDDHPPALFTPAPAVYLLGAYTVPSARGEGIGRALLARSLRWAREAGYGWCVLDYFPANPPAARFWEGAGFMPLAYRLCRQLDERVMGISHCQR